MTPPVVACFVQFRVFVTVADDPLADSLLTPAE